MAAQTWNISLSKPIDIVKAIRSRIEPHHFFGLLYIIIALAVARSEHQGVIGWFHTKTGIEADAAAILFALAGLALLFKPAEFVFIICLLPLTIYLVIATAFVIDSSRFSLTTTWFVISLMLFMWTLRFKRLWRFDVRHVFSLSSMILGITIFLYPDRGTAAWVHEAYLWLPAEVFALALIIAACLIPIGGKRVWTFGLGIIPLIVYAFASVVFAFNTAGLVAGWVTVLTLICVVWTSLNATEYINEAV